jgi:hypothetical protein
MRAPLRAGQVVIGEEKEWVVVPVADERGGVSVDNGSSLMEGAVMV